MPSAKEIYEEAVEDFLAMLLHGDMELTDRCAYRNALGVVVEVTEEVHRRYDIIRRAS